MRVAPAEPGRVTLPLVRRPAEQDARKARVDPDGRKVSVGLAGRRDRAVPGDLQGAVAVRKGPVTPDVRTVLVQTARKAEADLVARTAPVRIARKAVRDAHLAVRTIVPRLASRMVQVRIARKVVPDDHMALDLIVRKVVLADRTALDQIARRAVGQVVQVRIAPKAALADRMAVGRIVRRAEAVPGDRTAPALIALRVAPAVLMVQVLGARRLRVVPQRLMIAIAAAAMAAVVDNPVPGVRKAVNRARVVPKAVRSTPAVHKVAAPRPESRSRVAARSGAESVS